MSTLSDKGPRVGGASISVADLSPDQAAAYDAMVSWARMPVRLRSKPTLSVGGFAGCLSGETIVKYSRGTRVGHRDITLRDLYLKFNGFRGSGRGVAQRWIDLTVPTHLFSLWSDGTAAYNRIVAVFESGVKAVIRITVDDGNHLVLTPDHPIATPDGFVAAGELVIGNIVLGRGSLRPADEGKGRRPIDMRPPRVIVNTKYHPGPIKIVMCNGIAYEYVRVARARLVVEAAMNDLPYGEFIHALKKNEAASKEFKFLPQEVDVHHLDEDTLNDDISNLEVLPHAEHARIHTTERNAINVEYIREVRVTEVHSVGEEMTYDIQMEPPANNFAANEIFVHNTGKSTLTGIVGSLPDLQPIAFCAFTGKAASVLRGKLAHLKPRSTPYARDEEPHPDDATSFCGTIHSLLYRPILEGARIVGWELRDQLDADYKLIVTDESSMISDDLLLDLRSFGIPILAVGDHGQLPPVSGTGSLMQNPDIRLEKIHRQAEGNPIIVLSKSIRETGRLDRKLAGEHIRFVHSSGLERLLEERYSTPQLDEQVTITYTNRRRVMLNLRARVLLQKAGAPNEGDQVVCLKNVRGLPVYNGMRGVVVKTHGRDAKYPWQLKADVLFDDGTTFSPGMCVQQFNRDKTFSELDDVAEAILKSAKKTVKLWSWPDVGHLFDFGYAMTGHKCQGSQFEDVIVVVEQMPLQVSESDKRRWLYTCATRASQTLTLVQ